MLKMSLIITVLKYNVLGEFVPTKKWEMQTSVVEYLPQGGDSHMKQTGMLVGNFEFNP